MSGYKDILFNGDPESLRRTHYYDAKSHRWIERDSEEYYAVLRENTRQADINRRVNAYYDERMAELKDEFIASRLSSSATRHEVYLDDQAFSQWLREPGSGGTGPVETVTHHASTGFSGWTQEDGPELMVEEAIRRLYTRADRLKYECRQYRRQLEGKAADDFDPKPHGGPDGTSESPLVVIERKSVAYAVKALPNGSLSGYAAVFGNTDSYGDIIQPRAFQATLAAAKKRGRRFLYPLCRSHDISRIIGGVSEAHEDATGLHFTAQLALDTPDGKEAYSLIKQGMLSGVSIGYQTTSEDYDRAGHRLLKGINLVEISTTCAPANDLARIEVVG